MTIVANDTGGAICQILASERPERLRGLVLTNCDCLENFLPRAAPFPMARTRSWRLRADRLALRSARVRRSPLGFGMLTHRPIPDELTAAWAAPLGDRAVRADVIATVKAIHKRDTLTAAERLHEQPLPTLLAWAPDDLTFPLRFATRLAAMIPGARLEQIPDSRAFVPEDQPERARRADRGVRRGTRRVDPRQSSRLNCSRLMPAVRRMLPSVPFLIGWLPCTGTGIASGMLG